MVFNKSRTYLIYYFNQFIPIKFKERLLNTYIMHEGDFFWCMTYNFSGKRDFIEYESELTNSPYFLGTKNHDEKGNDVVYIFKIPDELIDVINLFTEGKYSELPDRDNLIAYILHFYNVTYECDVVGILTKDIGYRQKLEEMLNVNIPPKNELSTAPDLNKETYCTTPISNVNYGEIADFN